MKHMQHPAPPQRSRPRGFTLVELLVVVAILAMLIGLLTPAVMQARNSARDAAIKAEIEMLHMAIMNYKNEYGSFPPCVDPIRGRDDPNTTLSRPGVKHLQRLFPRCDNPALELQKVLGSVEITPFNAMAFWLSGFTGDPEKPLDPPANRRKLFNFDMSRVNAVEGYYTAPHSSGMPFVYIDSGRYLDVDRKELPPNSGRQCFVWRQNVNFSPLTNPPAAAPSAADPFFNADTFQIISAGRDGQFFTDDDISNMWPNTWGDWKDAQRSGR